jgi:hypothetical protein
MILKYFRAFLLFFFFLLFTASKSELEGQYIVVATVGGIFFAQDNQEGMHLKEFCNRGRDLSAAI